MNGVQVIRDTLLIIQQYSGRMIIDRGGDEGQESITYETRNKDHLVCCPEKPALCFHYSNEAVALPQLVAYLFRKFDTSEGRTLFGVDFSDWGMPHADHRRKPTLEMVMRTGYVLLNSGSTSTLRKEHSSPKKTSISPAFFLRVEYSEDGLGSMEIRL